MPSVNFQVNADANDWGFYSIWSTSPPINMGNFFGTARFGVRFTGIDLPAGTVINSAVLTVRAVSGNSGDTNDTCNVRISGNLADNPATPTNQTQDDALALTTNHVDWNAVPHFAAEGDFNAPDISTIIQELFDAGHLTGNKAFIILVKDNASDTTAKRVMFDYGSTPSKAVKLAITYTAPVPWQPFVKPAGRRLIPDYRPRIEDRRPIAGSLLPGTPPPVPFVWGPYQRRPLEYFSELGAIALKQLENRRQLSPLTLLRPAPVPIPILVQTDPRADPRTRQHIDLVAEIFNSLIMQGQVLRIPGHVARGVWELGYVPGNKQDWPPPAPTTIQEALDILAQLVDILPMWGIGPPGPGIGRPGSIYFDMTDTNNPKLYVKT